MSNDLTPPNLTPPPSEPPAGQVGEMEKSSPRVAKTFGIIHIVYGGLFLLVTIWGLVSSKMKLGFGGGGEIGEEMQSIQQQWMEMPKVKFFQYTSMGVGILMIVLLIIAGIMLLKRKQIGRTLSLVYGFASLFITFFSVLYQFLVVNKIFKELILNSSLPEQMASTVAMTINFTAIGQICCFVYPILILIFLLPEKFKRSLDE